MSRLLPGKIRTRLMVAALALSMPMVSAGCLVNMMALPFFLAGGDARQAPTGVALVTSKKETKKVLVLSYADFGLRNGHGTIDDDLAGLLIGELIQADERLKVVPERKVRQWRDRHPNWMDLELQDIGKEFGVDYVIFFEINQFKISDPKNAYLYQGQTSVFFRVHSVEKNTAIFTDTYTRDYPPNGPISVTDVASEDQFRQMFLRRISQELSWYVVPHNAVNPIRDL